VDAVLFDLDDTLIVEEPAAVAAFAATAAVAATVHPHLAPGELAVAARRQARALWHASPDHAYWAEVGISSWEALWCRWEGDREPVARTREWAAGYGREAWRLALAEQQIYDPLLAGDLAERFGEERRARHLAFTDAGPAVLELATTHRLGVITNGAACLQREKLEASGLAASFEVVVVSGDLGTGKPAPELFAAAVRRLGHPRRVTVVGDSYRKDVAGALAAGLDAIWLNRSGAERPAGVPEVPQIRSLRQLAATLAAEPTPA
jgi:putative hydrolase of the HAD superfamily